MADPEKLYEINKLKREPASALIEVLQRPCLRLIAFGERHLPANPQRQFVSSIIGKLAERSVRYLALELPVSSQTALDRFNNRQCDAQDLAFDLLDFGTSLFRWDEGKPTACPYYFQMLADARQAGVSIIAIDKDRGKHNEIWNSPEFAAEPRDKVMADSIIELLQSYPDSKVAYYGGNNHIYVRPKSERGKYLSLAERLSDFLSQNGSELWSVAGVMAQGSHSKSNSLSFASLTDCLVDQANPVWFTCDRSTKLADHIIGSQRRCPWGSCEESNYPKENCPGIIHNICGKERLTTVKLGYWNSFIFFPSQPRSESPEQL